eukprot:scaffold248501_cov111-Cyclotella_meneghiniana.AAC.2
MAKFDIKDGFWRLNARQGEEWNFAYVLPQREGEPTKLVVPLSLQMGWVESPPYFCAASETARDVAAQYTELPVGMQKDNKFVEYAMGNEAIQNLPEHDESDLRYFIDVYVDDFLSLAIATSRQQIRHCANGVMNGIHDVFREEKKPEDDPISLKKLKKDEGQYALLKDMLGFEFDGEEKTMILEEAKRGLLLLVLHKWIRTATLRDMRTIIREATAEPTKCRELVMGPPDFVGVQDASIYGMGAVIIGEEKACIPTVFRVEWPQWVQQEVLKTNAGKNGDLTNSDLEMAGLVLLWLGMEAVCPMGSGTHVALFSDNSPTVSWTNRLACRKSKVADQLIRALALRLKKSHTFHHDRLGASQNEYLDGLPAFTKNYLTDLLRVANEGFKNGRVDASTKARTAHWNRWRSHCQTLGVDPYLQGENFLSKCRTIQSFAAGVRTGRLGGGRQVRAGTVSQALSAVNTTIALAIDEQPFKVKGSKNFIPLIAQTLNGWEKEDPGVEKKMPVEADVPELLVDMGMEEEASELTKAHTKSEKELLSAYFVKGKRKDVKDSDIRAALKLAATALDYEGTRGIPTGKIDTHSLR